MRARRPRVRISVRRLLGLIALLGIFLGAWRFRSENLDIDRALTTLQLRSFAAGGPAERRRMIADLGDVAPDDLSRASEALLVALGDSDATVRAHAAQSLQRAFRRSVSARGPAISAGLDRAMAALIRSLADSSPEVRLHAAGALGILHVLAIDPRASRPATIPAQAAAPALGPVHERSARALLRALDDPDPKVRAAVVVALGGFGGTTVVEPDRFARVFTEDPDPGVRIAALGALVAGWPSDERLYSLFLNRLKTVTRRDERSRIGWALGGLPPPPLEDVPALVSLLKSGEFPFAWTVPQALAKLGPGAIALPPELLEAARRELAAADVEHETLAATSAVIAMAPGPSELLGLGEPLVAFLERSTASSRQRASTLLARLGPDAAPAVPRLITCLRQAEPDLRARAAHVLGLVGPAARPAVEDLKRLADRDPVADVRVAASKALERMAWDALPPSDLP